MPGSEEITSEEGKMTWCKDHTLQHNYPVCPLCKDEVFDAVMAWLDSASDESGEFDPYCSSEECAARFAELLSARRRVKEGRNG